MEKPENINELENVEYIRGQLEYSEKQYLHWQYFRPLSFFQSKRAILIGSYRAYLRDFCMELCSERRHCSRRDSIRIRG
jgi:hypothetical protein